MRAATVALSSCLAFILIATAQAFSQQQPAVTTPLMSKYDKERVEIMLDDIADDIQKHYYDPKIHGIDLKAAVATARQKIEKETALNMAMSHVAAMLDTLNDSHTFFLPPPRPYAYQDGWQLEMIGDRCFVERVRPGSDPEAQGVKAGDEVLSLNGFRPARSTLWKMQYAFKILRPQAQLRVRLRNPQGTERVLDVKAKFEPHAHLTDLTDANSYWLSMMEGQVAWKMRRPRYAEASDDVLIVKIPQFLLDDEEIGKLASSARKHKALVLDLRDNPGGLVDNLQHMVGEVMDHDVKIGDRVGRKDSKPLIAKSAHGSGFTGKLVVVVNSKSASAAELFARVTQLEKRGIVVGDRSSGSVMEAREFGYKVGLEIVTFFGASITDADIIMADGKSLEHNGVMPDEVVLPTAEDMAQGRDPVLARAVQLAGGSLSPEDAGKLFPYEWPKDAQ